MRDRRLRDTQRNTRRDVRPSGRSGRIGDIDRQEIETVRHHREIARHRDIEGSARRIIGAGRRRTSRIGDVDDLETERAVRHKREITRNRNTHGRPRRVVGAGKRRKGWIGDVDDLETRNIVCHKHEIARHRKVGGSPRRVVRADEGPDEWVELEFPRTRVPQRRRIGGVFEGRGRKTLDVVVGGGAAGVHEEADNEQIGQHDHR